MCDLKVTQKNMQRSPIRNLILYEFELSHNTSEAIKNISIVKGRGTISHHTVMTEGKNLYDQARSSRPKNRGLQSCAHSYRGKLGDYCVVVKKDTP